MQPNKTILVLGIVFLALLASTDSQAVGFQVKPMLVRLQGDPGNVLVFKLALSNTAPEPQDMTVTGCALTQEEDASLSFAEIGEAPVDSRSAMAWITHPLGYLRLGSYQETEVEISVRIPSNATGSYHAALIVEPYQQNITPGVHTVFRMVVPIFIEVKGVPARVDYDIESLELEFTQDSEQNKEGSYVSFGLVNKGETILEAGGSITVYAKDGERPRRVGVADIPTKHVLAGKAVRIGAFTEHPLPPGDYELRSDLRVDGRPAQRLIQEVAYKGHPDLLKNYSPLLAAKLVETDIRAGSRGSASAVVENIGIEDLVVSCSLADVPQYAGKPQYQCAKWGEIRPDTFELRSVRRRNVRVMLQAPEDISGPPVRYMLLRMTGKAADGSVKGGSDVLLAVKDPRAETLVKLGVAGVSASKIRPNEYKISFKTTNRGNIHAKVEPMGHLTEMNSRESIAGVSYGDNALIVLPGIETPATGSLDITGTKPGAYWLEVGIMHENRVESTRVPVKLVRKSSRENSLVLLR